jgi:hypothetical protein
VVLTKEESPVREDQLSPQLGRLIDAAKAAAARADPGIPRAEGVALLTGNDKVYAGCAGTDRASPLLSAADLALASAHRAGEHEVLAAAVAVVNDLAESTLLSPECYRSLVAIDPELPLVIKQKGRWVLLELSQLSPVA